MHMYTSVFLPLLKTVIVMLKLICLNEFCLPEDSDFQSTYLYKHNSIVLILFLIIQVFTICTSVPIFILASVSLMTILDRIKTKTVLLKNLPFDIDVTVSFTVILETM